MIKTGKRFAIGLMVATVLLYQTSFAFADGPRLLKDGPIARDYVQKLEWMRCSVGMVWDSDNCVGDLKMLSVSETEELLNRIKDLNGGGWRLPTVKELKSLVTNVDSRPKDIEPNIDQETFPGTFAGLYWSSDQSFYAKKYQWAVNFLTGHSYNRSFPYQKLAVRLVRNYRIK